jgi:hypothetical protein
MCIILHRYNEKNIYDIYSHLTNTARAAEKEYFDEKKFVKVYSHQNTHYILYMLVMLFICQQLLRDLPTLVMQQYPQKFTTRSQADDFVTSIHNQVHSITGELFAAYENEYSVFCPMAHCFELYGLDFLVDVEGNVSLLEVNPGPDFVQTGERLRSVIVQLWEQTFRIVVDTNILGSNSSADSTDGRNDEFEEEWASGRSERVPDFVQVYSKEWSVSKLQGGGGMTLH